jgi:uncharacterized protein (TIGR02145 family)
MGQKERLATLYVVFVINKTKNMKKNLTIIFAIALSLGVFAQNDTMFVHQKQYIYEFATAKIDSVIFYRTQPTTPLPKDTIIITKTDTIIKTDTIVKFDTITKTDTLTIVKFDTITKFDTFIVVKFDTIILPDTAIINALQREIDSLKIALQIASGTLVKDIDGNIYKTVKIGNQTWFIENLRVTRYNDGTPIDYVQDSAEWLSRIEPRWVPVGNPQILDYFSEPMFCFRDTSAENKVKYGASYNWFTIDPANGKQLCPIGWRVPSLNDFEILRDRLIADGYNFDGTITDDKIAKSMAVGNNWNYSNVVGSPGNSDFPEKKNASNFSVYPVGDRWGTNGAFMNFGLRGVFWVTTTRTSYGTLMARHASVFANYTFLFICPNGTFRASAHSIRCITD